MSSALNEHLEKLELSGCIDRIYREERLPTGVYSRFIREEINATESIKILLEKTIAPFWYSIRLFWYDSENDYLEIPLGLDESETITLSDKATQQMHSEERRSLHKERRNEIADNCFEKRASELGEFFFLIHHRDDEVINRENCFHCLTDEFSRRLYVLNWLKAEEWHSKRGVGRQIIGEWYKKENIFSSVPERFISVSPQLTPTQVVYISTFDKSGRVRGLASLRLFPGSLSKTDILSFDRLFSPITDLITPFIQTYSERLSVSKKLENRAIFLEKFTTILYHDMNNYLPGVSAVANSAKQIKQKYYPDSRNQFWNKLEIVAGMTRVRTERVERVRELINVLMSSEGRGNNHEINGPGRGCREILAIVSETIEHYGEGIALLNAYPLIKSIYSNLLGKYIQLIEIPVSTVSHSETQEFAFSVVIEELVKNAILATDIYKLEHHPITVGYEKKEANHHSLCISNIVNKKNPVTTEFLKSHIKGESTSRGKGLPACDFLLKTVFGRNSKIEPFVKESKDLKTVSFTISFPAM